MTFGSPRSTSRVGNAVNVNALALNAPRLGSSADPIGAAYRRNTEVHTALVGELVGHLAAARLGGPCLLYTSDAADE